MLEQPDLPDEQLVACVRDQYGLHAVNIAFLPVGADVHTAAYRVVAADGTTYFLKVRLANFGDTAVAVPAVLHVQDIRQLIAPIATRAGQLWATLDGLTVILYPFVAGRNGYDVSLSERQWLEFGAACKAIHGAPLPPALQGRLKRETYTPRWRAIVRTYQARVEDSAWDDPAAAGLAAFMRERRAQISQLVAQAERLGRVLQAREPNLVLCHSDLHPGNILVGDDGALYIVDWDDPILAPKERDLMFIGGGFWNTPQQEELFYRGYGPVAIDPIALAYYRYERIVQDIAVYCEQLLQTDIGGADRAQALHWLTGSFLPGHDVDMACRSEKLLPPELRYELTRAGT
jgi:spectinomycin phosphotransferase